MKVAHLLIFMLLAAVATFGHAEGSKKVRSIYIHLWDIIISSDVV